MDYENNNGPPAPQGSLQGEERYTKAEVIPDKHGEDDSYCTDLQL